MSAGCARVFVVDDDQSLARALKRVLTAAGHEVELFDSAAAFLAREPFHGCGCILLDLQMPDMNGLQFQEELNKRQSLLPIVFISGHGDIPASVRAMRQGARDFLTKPVRAQDLLTAVEDALSLHRHLLDSEASMREFKERFEQLTLREREVCLLVSQGLPNKQIAYDLGISEPTVKIHRARVFSKMKVTSVVNLVRLLDALKPAALTAPNPG